MPGDNSPLLFTYHGKDFSKDFSEEAEAKLKEKLLIETHLLPALLMLAKDFKEKIKGNEDNELVIKLFVIPLLRGLEPLQERYKNFNAVEKIRVNLGKMKTFSGEKEIELGIFGFYTKEDGEHHSPRTLFKHWD